MHTAEETMMLCGDGTNAVRDEESVWVGCDIETRAVAQVQAARVVCWISEA
jgi:hypothetical protein